MKMRAALLGLLLLSTAAGVSAVDDWRLVVRLQGRVQSSVDQQKSWQPVFAQRLLRVNDSARTEADSKARIQLPDGSVAVMAPNTVATLESFNPSDNSVKIYVETGGMRAKVTKTFGRGRFELNTKNGVLAAQGTEYACIYEGDNVLGFVYEGKVSFEPKGGSAVLLKAGEAARMGADGTIQVNPPDLSSSMLPPALLPEASVVEPKETSTYIEATGSGQTSALARFNQLNGFLLPSDAGRPGEVSRGGGPVTPVTPQGPAGNPTVPGTIQVDIRF